MKKILILGGNSDIGIQLLKKLLNTNNFEIHLHYNKKFSIKKFEKKIKLIKIDLGNINSKNLNKKFDSNYDIIVNLVGYISNQTFLNFDIKNPGASRLVDEDFNRVWLEERLDSDENTVELLRARALRPIFDTVDYLLDIHSLSTYSKALTICHGHKKETDFAQKVNYPSYIMAGSGHVVGCRLIEYKPFNDINNDKVALLVECGQHWAKETGVIALDTALHFLRATEAVKPEFIDQHMSKSAKNPPKAEMWEVVDGIWSKTDKWEYAEEYIGMEIIAKAGTVFALDGEEEIKTPHADCLLMMPSYKPGAKERKVRLCKRLS